MESIYSWRKTPPQAGIEPGTASSAGQQLTHWSTGVQSIYPRNKHHVSLSPGKIISIYHVCMVWIEKSVTRVTDRHHEACRVMPNSDPEWQIFLSTPYTHERYFFLHTFWYTTFDCQSRTCYEITLFPLNGFYLSFKEVHATSERRSVLYVNV